MREMWRGQDQRRGQQRGVHGVPRRPAQQQRANAVPSVPRREIQRTRECDVRTVPIRPVSGTQRVRHSHLLPHDPNLRSKNSACFHPAVARAICARKLARTVNIDKPPCAPARQRIRIVPLATGGTLAPRAPKVHSRLPQGRRARTAAKRCRCAYSAPPTASGSA